MPTLVVEKGVVSWAAAPLVATEDVDAYATARSWSDWAAAGEGAKAAAILDASTYVRAVWSPPKTYSASADATVADAIAEASRLALTAPLIGGDGNAQASVVRERVGSIEVQYAEQKPVEARDARLGLVSALLRSAGAYRASGLMVRLGKA